MKNFRLNLATLLAVVFSACSADHDALVDLPQQSNDLDKYMSVSIEEAQQTLEEFSTLLHQDESSRSPFKLRIAEKYSTVIKTETSRAGETDSSYIHIFNFEDNDGFAIMSGDKRVPPVLAFTENGNLPKDSGVDNPGFAIFLEGLEDFYFNSIANYTVENTEPSSRGTVTRPAEITISNKANCKVKWDQGAPYNNLCPMLNGERALAGCVPVACAQLMSVYKHPQKYNSSTFTWNDMTAYPYAGSCSTTAQSQIADLLYQLGRNGNLGVSYGNKGKGSGAKVEDIPQTLRNFGYSNGGRLTYYSEKDVISEIGAGYPVIISGFRTYHDIKILGLTINSSYRDGHAWLADGYAKFFKAVDVVDDNGRILSSTWYTTYYIRCNWGWGGYEDGYFLSGAFHPSAGPSMPDNYNGRSEDFNYQYRVENITGIRK